MSDLTTIIMYKDIIREYICSDEEFLKLGDVDILSMALDFMFYEDRVLTLDRPYLDVAYLRVGDFIINIDSLYLDIKSLIEDSKPKFEEFELTPEEAITLSNILELESMSDSDNFEFEDDYKDHMRIVESILVKLQKTYNV